MGSRDEVLLSVAPKGKCDLVVVIAYRYRVFPVYL